MVNGKQGKKDYKEFVINDTDDIIFMESLIDTCESCYAVSCALCPLYHLNRRVVLRTKDNMTRKEANDSVRYLENSHVSRMNKKYDTSNRYDYGSWHHKGCHCESIQSDETVEEIINKKI